jgi:hypothetical protein
MGIFFMTLRRRSQKMLQLISDEPVSAWRRIELESVSRIYRTPRILDQKIVLKDYLKVARKTIPMLNNPVLMGVLKIGIN